MPSRDPTQVAQKWQRNLLGSTQSIKDGVQAVTVSPMQQAAAAGQKWQQKMQLQSTYDKWRSGLNRRTLEDWKNAILSKGLNNLSNGVQNALPKEIAFLTQFLPFVQSVAAQVHQMPNVTLEDGVARASAQIRGNAAFKRTQ